MFTVDENHPLLVGTHKTILHWYEWKQRWDEAPNLETRLGLLSVGFDIAYGYDPYDKTTTIDDRICFYLSVADGHRYSTNFQRVPDDHRIQGEVFGKHTQNLTEALQRVAKQAFKALAGRFFRDKEDRREPGRFETTRWLEDEKVIGKLLWFFRVDKNGRIRNLDTSWDRDPQSEAATKFLEDLCLYAFSDESSLRSRERGSRPRISAILYPLRKEVIPILCAGGWAEELLHPRRACYVDESCMEALWEVGRQNYPYDKPFDTIEQACHAGSSAAMTLYILRMLKKERGRQRKERDLILAKEQAERELSKLRSE